MAGRPGRLQACRPRPLHPLPAAIPSRKRPLPQHKLTVFHQGFGEAATDGQLCNTACAPSICYRCALPSLSSQTKQDNRSKWTFIADSLVVLRSAVLKGSAANTARRQEQSPAPFPTKKTATMFNKNWLTILALLINAGASADNHRPDQGLSTLSMQVNACYLNEGSNWQDLEKLDKRFQAWTRENNVERTVVRHTHLMFSSRPERRLYIDYHIGPYAVAGKLWKLFQTTPKGRAMNEEWQRVADNRLMMNTMHRKYAVGVPKVGQQRVV